MDVVVAGCPMGCQTVLQIARAISSQKFSSMFLLITNRMTSIQDRQRTWAAIAVIYVRLIVRVHELQ